MINVAPLHDVDYHLREVTHDPAAYYLREGEAPGFWRGAGAATLGLAGEVTAQALHDLCTGKDPTTGRYLTTARGSSARAEARRRGALLDTRATAAALGLTEAAVRTRLRAGSLAGGKGPDGVTWRIPAEAVEAYRAGRPQPAVSAGAWPEPVPDGTYSLAEAARAVGVDRSHLQRLVAEAPPEGEALRPDGTPAQYLVGAKDGRGH